jgi:drug/metabolite transporter (DMT)-like permease
LGLISIPLVDTPRLAWTANVIAAIGVTAVLATALAFLVQTWAQKFTTPTRTALIFALEPVFAFVTSYIVAGEELSARAFAGAGCILAGIVLVELKPMRVRQHPHS